MDQATWLEAKGDIALSRLLKLKSEALSLRMAGLAMSQAWVYTVLFSRGLSPEASDPASIHSSFYEVSLVALVAMLLVAGLTAVPIRSLMETPVGPWIPGLLCAGGTIVLPFGSPDALSSAALMGGRRGNRRGIGAATGVLGTLLRSGRRPGSRRRGGRRLRPGVSCHPCLPVLPSMVSSGGSSGPRCRLISSPFRCSAPGYGCRAEHRVTRRS